MFLLLVASGWYAYPGGADVICYIGRLALKTFGASCMQLLLRPGNNDPAVRNKNSNDKHHGVPMLFHASDSGLVRKLLKTQYKFIWQFFANNHAVLASCKKG